MGPSWAGERVHEASRTTAGFGAEHDANTKRAYDVSNHKYGCKNNALQPRLHKSIGNSVLPFASVGSLLLHSIEVTTARQGSLKYCL